MFSGTASFFSCQIYNNKATLKGGAIYIQDGAISLRQCDIFSNEAAWQGGGVYAQSGTFSLIWTTVVLNTAINSHSDLFVSQDVTLSIGTDDQATACGAGTSRDAATGECRCQQCLSPPSPLPPSPAPRVGPCASWCANSPKPWTTKCGFTGCSGCEPCPGPSPSSSPPPPFVGLCGGWCGSNPNSWTIKCDFVGCSGCQQCSTTDPVSPAPPAPPPPSPSPPPPSPLPCGSWCAGNPNPWSAKCTAFAGCMGCQQCST